MEVKYPYPRPEGSICVLRWLLCSEVMEDARDVLVLRLVIGKDGKFFKWLTQKSNGYVVYIWHNRDNGELEFWTGTGKDVRDRNVQRAVSLARKNVVTRFIQVITRLLKDGNDVSHAMRSWVALMVVAEKFKDVPEWVNQVPLLPVVSPPPLDLTQTVGETSPIPITLGEGGGWTFAEEEEEEKIHHSNSKKRKIERIEV